MSRVKLVRVNDIEPFLVLDAGTITATPGDNTVAVAQGTAPSGGYPPYTRNIYRSTTNGVKGSLLASDVSLPYDDNTASNGTTFYYTLEVGDGVSTEDTAQVSATPEASGDLFATPNEPAGFTAELEEPWDSISGSYYVNSGQFGGSVEASGGALLFTMPNGFTLGGHAPGYVYTRDNTDHGPSQYMRHVIELDADWVGHPELVNKLFFWSDGSAAAQGYVALHGSGSSDLRPIINTQSWAHGTSRLDWDGGTGGETNLSGISSAGAVVARGEQFQLEVLVDTEAAGGTVKLWINGVLILHYEGIEFGDTFDNPRIEPVYGGVNGGTYSGATQYMWFHDTYVSSGSV